MLSREARSCGHPQLSVTIRAVRNLDRELNEAAERQFNDTLAERYFQVWDTFPIQRYTDRVEQQLLTAVVQRGVRVLVLGVGGGRELPALLAAGCDVVAVDISPNMLRIGRERYGDDRIEWRAANVNNLPADLTEFDCMVGLGGIMNYQLDLATTLRDLRGRLNPGGALVFDSFNREFPGETAEYELNGRVRRSYGMVELIDLCSDAGFPDVAASGHRYLVDQLDPVVNRNPDDPRHGTLLRLLELEESLDGLIPAERAKLLVITAHRDG